MNTAHQDQADKYCLFRCSGELFCMPALAVRHVVPKSDTTEIPLSTGALAGLVKIQQELISLFSIDSLYGSNQACTTDYQKVLVVIHDTGPWGLLIDEVEKLAELEVSICPQPNHAEQPNFVIGSATFQDQFVSVIDPENLYTILTDQLQQHWTQFAACEHSDSEDPVAAAN